VSSALVVGAVSPPPGAASPASPAAPRPHSDNEEHIYEEIVEESGEEEGKEEVSEHSFLALISLERRKHLKFYGRTDWDYGNERF